MAVKKTTSTSRAAAKIANAIKAEPAKAAKTAAKAVKEEEKTAVKAEEKAEVKASEKAPVKAEPEKKEAAKAIETKKDFDKAIGVYDEAIEINPNFAQAYHERGRIKLLKGDKDGSVEDMKKAMELAPETEGNISGQYNNYENMTKNVPF